MREFFGDLWSVEADAVVITTNGFVKQDGRCVMGRGCAREARDRFPAIDVDLGALIRRNGNHVQIIRRPEYQRAIVAFPVKHNWWEEADYGLISRSAVELVELADEQGWQTVAMPRPGSGNGRRPWEQVRRILEPILDDRFVVCHK